MNEGQMYLKTTVAGLMCCIAGAANAEWTAKVEGPDVFGNTTVHAGTATFREGFVINCDAKGELNIAMIYSKKPFDKVHTAPAQLLIQIDGGTPVKFSATHREWNEARGGIVASGRSPETIAILRAIAGGREKINVGVVINGNQVSASFGVGGSRSAIEKTIKACKLDDAPKS
jgi:hypothetical protein